MSEGVTMVWVRLSASAGTEMMGCGECSGSPFCGSGLRVPPGIERRKILGRSVINHVGTIKNRTIQHLRRLRPELHRSPQRHDHRDVTYRRLRKPAPGKTGGDENIRPKRSRRRGHRKGARCGGETGQPDCEGRPYARAPDPPEMPARALAFGSDSDVDSRSTEAGFIQ